MLRSLYIQNYALIEKLDISFGAGFSVITGETGAGKTTPALSVIQLLPEGIGFVTESHSPGCIEVCD